MPETWILGSSDYGAQVAAHFGLPYCFAHFITDGQGAAEALDLYRTRYQPSARHPAPYAAIAIWALAADTMEEASHLLTSRALWRLGRDPRHLHRAADAGGGRGLPVHPRPNRPGSSDSAPPHSGAQGQS